MLQATERTARIMNGSHLLEIGVAAVFFVACLLQLASELKTQRRLLYIVSPIWAAQTIATIFFILPWLQHKDQSLSAGGIMLVALEALLAILYFAFLGISIRDSRLHR